MTIIDDLIFDRNAVDVSNVKALRALGIDGMSAGQLTTYLSGMKGAYNYTDLNRVGQAVQYIADELTAHEFPVTVNPKTDWTRNDIPTLAQMTAYLDDIAAIKAALPLPEEAGEVPSSMAGLDYKKANDIERILYYADLLVQTMVAIFQRCGIPYSGAADKYLPYGINYNDSKTVSGALVTVNDALPIAPISLTI